MHRLLAICDDFAKKNFIEFGAAKSVVLLVLRKAFNLETMPKIYLGGSVPSYVEMFKYLGHILFVSFTDDEDIDREKRNLAMRGNLLICIFFTEEVKCHLFRTYCGQFYTCSL